MEEVPSDIKEDERVKEAIRRGAEERTKKLEDEVREMKRLLSEKKKQSPGMVKESSGHGDGLFRGEIPGCPLIKLWLCTTFQNHNRLNLSIAVSAYFLPCWQLLVYYLFHVGIDEEKVELTKYNIIILKLHVYRPGVVI